MSIRKTGVMGVNFSKPAMKGVVRIPLRPFAGLKLKPVHIRREVTREARLFRERK